MSDPISSVGESAKRPERARTAGIFTLFVIMIMVLAAGSVVFVAQLNSLKTELLSARKEVSAAKDRIARLERRIDEPISAQGRLQASRVKDGVLSGGEGGEESSARPALELSREEIRLLRDYIKVPPAPPGATPAISVGGAVPIAMLVPLPSQVSEKVPKLIGARFMTDRNGAIVVVRRGSRQADAVVNPD